MKSVYGYIRVSTVKQGLKGVSLTEQKDAIQHYANNNNLTITSWFEERETAAKLGRRVFKKMLTQLQSGLAQGVVIHKIDRSARNLRDWAELVDLADQGTEVHFVNESIDMGLRGGRLSADIQAVVAADYIRNLREETIKGIRGRLKQGLYPFRAPIGYLDQGGGEVKAIDPIKGPIIKSLFEKYATGEYSLKELLAQAGQQGLINAGGSKVTLNGMSTILHNPFYTGIIFIKRTGESFSGIHQPIITQDLFNKVQAVLSNKNIKGNSKHEFLYRRMFSCVRCQRSLIAERQKGRVYYRCHLCPGVSVREDAIDQTIEEVLQYCILDEAEIKIIETVEQQVIDHGRTKAYELEKALQLELSSLEQRLSNLTDLLLDGTVDKTTYLEKKNDLIKKVNLTKEKLAKKAAGLSEEQQTKLMYLELYKSFYSTYQTDVTRIKRQMIKEVTSNRLINRKNVTIELHQPFYELCMIKKAIYGDPCRGWSRTFRRNLGDWIEDSDAGKIV